MDWLIWQLADSAFPAGGFAHSFGLEAAAHLGVVDSRSLYDFVRDTIDQAGHATMPFVTTAHATGGGRASSAPTQTETLGEIDSRCDAFLRNVVANRASRMQGRAWMATVEKAFPRPAIVNLSEAARTLPARHYAPLVGASLAALDVSLEDAQRLFLFTIARGVLSAAVRLGLAGTTDAQRMLAECAPDLDRTLALCASHHQIDDAAHVAPMLDFWQSSHDRLYSRLFQS